MMFYRYRFNLKKSEFTKPTLENFIIYIRETDKKGYSPKEDVITFILEQDASKECPGYITKTLIKSCEQNFSKNKEYNHTPVLNIEKIGDPCRHCGTPVVLKKRRKGETTKFKKSFYFVAFFACQHCKAIYLKDYFKIMDKTEHFLEEVLEDGEFITLEKNIVKGDASILEKLIKKWKSKGMYQLPKREPRVPCPECHQGNLIERSGKFGPFTGCSRFPDCRYTRR